MTKGWLNDDFDVPGDITAGGIENTPIGNTTASTIEGTTGQFSSNVQIDGNILDSNGNEAIEIASTASAVNHVTVVNAPTLNAPSVEAAGSDANIDLKLASKGTGKARMFTNGNEAFRIDSNGIITTVLQPAFQARVTSTASNVTGDGTAYTVIFDTETTDRNSDYNTGTGTFTAPATGLYELATMLRCSGVNTAHTSGTISFVTSNRTYQQNNDPGGLRDASGAMSPHLNLICDMDSADTATVQLTASNDTKTMDVQGNASDGRSIFCGWLLG
jgi:hypothetical protein